MSKYQKQTGQVWRRCSSVVIDNPLGGMAFITFNEQNVITVGEDITGTPAGVCRKKFSSPLTFPLRDPQTNELIGQTMTHLDVYKILHSLYIHTAMQRDGVIPPDEPTTGDPGTTMFY